MTVNKHKKNNLTQEDLSTAKEKILDFIKGNTMLMGASGTSAVLGVLASVADKLCRDNDGNFKPGWFYSYITSNLLSGASVDLLQNYMKKRQISIESNIAEKTHQMFDTFSIDERRSRTEDIDKTMEDIQTMKKAATGYLGAKSGLISGTISSAALVGTTLISGGLASLPIMGGVIATSAISSYFISRRLNQEKIESKNRIRKANSRFKAADRQAFMTSYKTETSDPNGRSKEIFDDRRHASEKEYHKLSDILSKYALIGTAVKTAVVAGVIAATISNPVNALVSVAATLGTYGAVNRCVNSFFALKEHIGNFANAYKSFLPKQKVKYGKEKIPQKANVIELENVVVHRKDPHDSTKSGKDILFSVPEKQYIGPGITLLSGASGAGKSTLINLLMHSHDVDSGTIKIGSIDEHGKFNGMEYDRLAFAEPSRHIAISMQKPEFTEMTVDEFIRLSNPNAPEELVQEVMDIVGIKDDPSRPELISPNKIIRGNGKGLSGGQSNRLNLAQALIKDSPILILDEPTAGVDATMEENIAQYLNKIKKDKTIIYITHNIEDVRDLQIDQALDLGKDEGAKYATMVRYDLRDKAAKEEYMKFFVDRNIGRSPSSPTLTEADLVAVQKNEKKKMANNTQKLENKLKIKNLEQKINLNQSEEKDIAMPKTQDPQQMFSLKDFFSGYEPRE